MSALDTILTRTRADIDALRDEASDHTREAGQLGDQMKEPAARLEDMAREEADLMRQAEEIQRKLDALRPEMISVRSAYDVIAAERDEHLRRAQKAADAADYFEHRTLPDLAVLLDAPPPDEALAATGLMVEPPKVVDVHPAGQPDADMPDGLIRRDEPLTEDEYNEVRARWEQQHAPADQPVAVHGPTTTMPDLGPKREPLDPPPGEGTHSHAKPAEGLMSRVTGGFKALGRKHDEQDGDA